MNFSEPDNEAPKAMGSVADQKWMKEYEEKLCSIKQEAITAFADGDYEKAAGLFTEAIKMNSSSDQVWMYTKRANWYGRLLEYSTFLFTLFIKSTIFTALFI